VIENLIEAHIWRVVYVIDNQATENSRNMNAHPNESQHKMQQLVDHKENLQI